LNPRRDGTATSSIDPMRSGESPHEFELRISRPVDRPMALAADRDQVADGARARWLEPDRSDVMRM